MNIFIDGPFDGQNFHTENYTGNQFKVSDLNTYTSILYLKNEVEKNGLKYTFWIPESTDQEYANSRVQDILKNK